MLRAHDPYLAERGELPFFRLGGSMLRIKREDVETYEGTVEIEDCYGRAEGRSKLNAVLTDKGQERREASYVTEQIIVRVTEPQIKL